jgi:phosphonopyruvate decarboxylase
MVYMQNSGIGNAVNPIASLLNERVYGIPCVFVIGWRGEPGIKDEPQHKFQGEITVPLLTLLEIECYTLTEDTLEEDFANNIMECKKHIENGKSVAFIIKKDALFTDRKANYISHSVMKREAALKVILDHEGENDVFVSTTGKTSRELFELRESMNQTHQKDFLTVGSMGHASMIAMGIALEKPERLVWCIDGDGAALMHFGSFILSAKTRCENLIYVVINNGAHETVGGMPVSYATIDFRYLAEASGFDNCIRVNSEEELAECINGIKDKKGTKMIEVMVALGSRKDLGRPTTTPQENKKALMNYISGGEAL